MQTSAPDPEAPPYRHWGTAWRVVLPPIGWLARAGWHLEVTKEQALPPGPAVYAANHLSHLDIPMLAVAVDRPMRFLAVDELWGDRWWMKRFLRLFGAIPLSRRRPPLGAVRAALSHLAEDGVIGVFPEGGIRSHFDLDGLHPAAAWVSLRSGAPLIPVAIRGTEQAYGLGAKRVRRSRVEVRLGSPIRPDAVDGEDDPVRALLDRWASWMVEHVPDGWNRPDDG